MQAMFNGDDDTPSVHLERSLRDACKTAVSILNTGHIGYSPEQYYYTLREYGERFHPQFLVVSVCPNDFGPGWDVLRGKGDWYDEAEYWLDLIQQWCQSHGRVYLLVARAHPRAGRISPARRTLSRRRLRDLPHQPVSLLLPAR